MKTISATVATTFTAMLLVCAMLTKQIRRLIDAKRIQAPLTCTVVYAPEHVRHMKAQAEHYSRGKAFLDSGRLSEGEAEFVKSNEEFGKADSPMINGSAERGLGDVNFLRKDYSAAVRHYKRVLAGVEDGSSTKVTGSVHDPGMFFMLAIAAAESGQKDDAAASYRRACEQVTSEQYSFERLSSPNSNPRNYEKIVVGAYAYLTSPDNADHFWRGNGAVDVMTNVVARFPASALAHLGLGRVLLSQKNYVQASHSFEQAAMLGKGKVASQAKTSLDFIRLTTTM